MSVGVTWPTSDWFLNLKLAGLANVCLTRQERQIELMDNVMVVPNAPRGHLVLPFQKGANFKDMIRMLKALKKELRGSHTKAIHGTLARFYRAPGRDRSSLPQTRRDWNCLVNCLRYGGAQTARQ